MQKSEKSEEKSLEKTTLNGRCPFNYMYCHPCCSWNQGDYCIIYDIRNTFQQIAVELENLRKTLQIGLGSK